MTEERLAKIKKLKDDSKAKTKDKAFKNLTAKEKDEKLETVCSILGLI